MRTLVPLERRQVQAVPDRVARPRRLRRLRCSQELIIRLAWPRAEQSRKKRRYTARYFSILHVGMERPPVTPDSSAAVDGFQRPLSTLAKATPAACSGAEPGRYLADERENIDANRIHRYRPYRRHPGQFVREGRSRGGGEQLARAGYARGSGQRAGR